MDPATVATRRLVSCSRLIPLILLSAAFTACSTGSLDANARDGEPGLGSWNGTPPVCPIDPDCHIGGDCSLYECPEHWECQEPDGGPRVCINPGPDYPDGEAWDCFDREGQTVCQRPGDFPDEGSGAGWDCERSAELIECTSDTPSYPDGGGAGSWSCWFSGEFRVCETHGGDDGGWDCVETGAGRRCVQREPSYPDDRGWDCEDRGSETRCTASGDLPDGGGGSEWDCERGTELVECVNSEPDYPDGGSGGPYDCTYSDELRLCDGPGYPDEGCRDDARGGATFADGDGDGQLMAFGDGSRDQECGTVTVDVTGYYRLYDEHIAESCDSQLDESGYLSIANSCNPSGAPVAGSVGPHHVVADIDNTPRCSVDEDCVTGQVCREGNARIRCCVPDGPVYMGTFLLRAGEPNRICLKHLCALWRDTGEGDALVNAGCEGSVNSIHLLLDETAFLCVHPALATTGCE